jgi:hypothetical protein
MRRGDGGDGLYSCRHAAVTEIEGSRLPQCDLFCGLDGRAAPIRPRPVASFLGRRKAGLRKGEATNP